MSEIDDRDIFDATYHLEDLANTLASCITSAITVFVVHQKAIKVIESERDTPIDIDIPLDSEDELRAVATKLAKRMKQLDEIDALMDSVSFTHSSLFLRLLDSFENYTKRTLEVYIRRYPNCMISSKQSDRDKEFEVPISKIIQYEMISPNLIVYKIVTDFVNSLSSSVPYINTINFLEKKSNYQNKLYSRQDKIFLHSLFNIRNSLTHEISKINASDLKVVSDHFKFTEYIEHPIDFETIREVATWRPDKLDEKTSPIGDNFCL